MFQYVKFLIIACVLLLTLSSCNIGIAPNTVSISATVTTGSCIDMSSNNLQNNSCVITLTYNTAGSTDLNLTVNSTTSPIPNSITDNPVFNASLTLCRSDIRSAISGSGTCDIRINYTNNRGTDTYLTFSLGNRTSNKIRVTGF